MAAGVRAIPVLLVLCAAAPVRAERVAVVAQRAAAAPASAEQLLAALARALGDAADTDPFAVARDNLAAGAVPAARLARFADAVRLVDEGWHAYLAVNKSFALARLGEARRVAEELVDLEGGRELFADASLRLGVVSLDLGNVAEAADLFRLAVALDPGRQIGIAEFHPDVVRAVESAVAARPAALRVVIGVAAGEGDDATVEVDGHAAGTAPAAVDLAVGQHVAVARRPGYTPRGQVFAVRPGGADRVTIELDRDPTAAAVLTGPSALAVGRSDAEARVATEGLLVWGEHDAVLLAAVVWRRGQPALLGQLCSGVPVRCGPVDEVGYPVGALDAGARQLVGRLRTGGGRRSFAPYLLGDTRLVRGEGDPHTPVVPGHRPWWRSPYLWVGAGAAAIAVGGWALLGRDRTVTPVISVQPCDWTGSCLTASR